MQTALLEGTRFGGDTQGTTDGWCFTREAGGAHQMSRVPRGPTLALAAPNTSLRALAHIPMRARITDVNINITQLVLNRWCNLVACLNA